VESWSFWTNPIFIQMMNYLDCLGNRVTVAEFAPFWCHLTAEERNELYGEACM
jgi:hypothetical protein